jgi:predicted TIM-barrel fold metal-dependent hydrolase
MKGFKLSPTCQNFYPNDPTLHPVCATEEELGLPVIVHADSSVFRGAPFKYGDPLCIHDFAVDFP